LLSAAESEQLSNDITEDLPPGRPEGDKDPQVGTRDLFYWDSSGLVCGACRI
jgi:hypothetical protein